MAALQVTDAHLSAYAGDPAAYHIAEGLKWVLERALEPSLKNRYTISDLVGALRCVVEGRYFCALVRCTSVAFEGDAVVCALKDAAQRSPGQRS